MNKTLMMRNCKVLPPEIQEWIDIVENETYRCCKEQKLLVAYVKKCFEEEDIYVDTVQLSKYMHLIDEYVPYKSFPWQKFCIALHDCTYRSSDHMPRWKNLFAMLGRGAGKDGMIAIESFLLSSPYNGIREYDVDICAMNEEQAMRPVTDLINFFETCNNQGKIKRFYKWTQEIIKSIKTLSKIRGRTNNPKGKDGMRSGIIIFNELHQYQDYKNIDVFTTGLGKKKHPRKSFYTTNGEVREGPLDDMMADASDVLEKGYPDGGTLYFICRLDDKNEVHDEKNWTKANPSIPYLPDLLEEIRDEYREWKKNPDRSKTFLQRRMNLIESTEESAVASWEQISATNKEIPDLKGWHCTVGIDYAKTTDWVAVNLHFRDGDNRYDINKAWICAESKDIPRIKAPWRQWAETDYLEEVKDKEIHPSIVANYIQEMGRIYSIDMVAIDNYRYTLLSDALAKVGIAKEYGNLMLIRQVDIIKVVPVIDRCFLNSFFYWGNNPVLRWATNNTKTIHYGRNQGADKGSFVYAKIEGKSRKTDPFMALVASMVPEDRIKVRPKMMRAKVIRLV